MLFYLPWKHQNKRVYSCNINDNIDNVDNVDNIRDWVISQNPSNQRSTHWWYNELPYDIHKSFSTIAKCDKIYDMFNSVLGNDYRIDILDDMNEIYISAPTETSKLNDTSDNIFYTRHIDGPYFYIPFASCYRLIVGLDNNEEISTVFNLIPEVHTLKKCDVVAFDFHRECHYIVKNNIEKKNKEMRVILKIHYCVYPYWAYYIGKLLGKLSIIYNKNFRNLFLFTLNTNSTCEKIVVKSMILTTKLVHDIEFYIGYNNISFIFIIFCFSLKTNYYVFLFCTSFVHYFRIIDSVNNNCNNLILKRDYRLYNVIYIIQLLYLCYLHNSFSLIRTYFIYFMYIIPHQHILKFCKIVLLLHLFNNNYLFTLNNIYVSSHLLLSSVEYFQDFNINYL
jgi:hypothetical protein